MPGWHDATKEMVKQGRLVVVGVAQEFHADRCQLYAQWKQFDFPILHDPLNMMDSRGVPIVVALDEKGVVLSVGLKARDLEKTFPKLSAEVVRKGALDLKNKPSLPDVKTLRTRAEKENSAAAWVALGDALALWEQKPGDAIESYQKAVELEPRNGQALFRQGVCYSMRNESEHSLPGDFQKAVDAWSKALATNPNQYIWRRRIQQYGSSLDKPYPFYDWVEQAVAEVRAKGEVPVALRVALTASERARPARDLSDSAGNEKEPDSTGAITRDTFGLIAVEEAVVPSLVSRKKGARVHLSFRPSKSLKAHWNNASGDSLVLWIDPPEGWRMEKQLLTAKQPETEQSSELRHLDFGIRPPENVPARTRAKLRGYALYWVCEDVDGTCRLLRRDVEVDLVVGR